MQKFVNTLMISGIYLYLYFELAKYGAPELRTMYMLILCLIAGFSTRSTYIKAHRKVTKVHQRTTRHGQSKVSK